MIENYIINSFNSLDINKSSYDYTNIDKINEVNLEKNSKNASECLESFGEIIFVNEENHSDNENSDDLTSRGPIKFNCNKQRSLPYPPRNNVSSTDSSSSNNYLNLKIDSQLKGYLTPPNSSQLSPPRQDILYTELYSPPYHFTPEFSPKSNVSSDFYDQVGDDFKIVEMNNDIDSGIDASLSKQSSRDSPRKDIMSGIDSPEGIEYPEVVENLINNLEDGYEDVIDYSSLSKIKDACIAVANMDRRSLEKIDSDGDHCLIVATAKNQVFLVKALVQRLKREGIFLKMINFRNNDGITALYVAVVINNPLLVENLIINGADINLSYDSKPKDKMNSHRFQLVHYASERGSTYIDTLRQLLHSVDLKIDCYNSKGETPLICAIEKHNFERNIDSRQTIMLLVQKGADLLKRNDLSNKPPLQIAIERKSPEIVELLIQLAIKKTERNIKTKLTFGLESFQNMQNYIPLIDKHHNGYNEAITTDQNLAGEKLPSQVQQYNNMAAGINKSNVDKQLAEKQSILDQMLNFRNGLADFSLLGCAYDVCKSCGFNEKTKDVIKLLLTNGATLPPKSKPHPVSQLPEFLGFQRKKK